MNLKSRKSSSLAFRHHPPCSTASSTGCRCRSSFGDDGVCDEFSATDYGDEKRWFFAPQLTVAAAVVVG